MIRIESPCIRQEERTVLYAPITLEGKRQEAWFSVEAEYGKYLVEDRLDAFVVGFLTTAMRLGEDITCEAPISRRLHYQLTEYLIPAMAANMEIYHAITIHAPLTDAPLPCQKAVGTGWTGGVDSMYTLMTHLQAAEPSRRLTHLMVANVGTLEGDDTRKTLRHMTEKAKGGVASELGLGVVSVDSNLQELQSEKYLAVAGFRLPAAVLALQKLFGVFYNSACYEFHRFFFVQEDSAYYELLPLSCFETDTTVLYSTGGQVSRMGKLQALSDYPLAHKYLHPCIYIRRDNCCSCGKCVFTLGALYALGTLERFGAVFDVERFHREKDSYIANILSHRESQHYGEVLAMMRRRGLPISAEALRKERIRRAATLIAQKKLKGD